MQKVTPQINDFYLKDFSSVYSQQHVAFSITIQET